MKLISCEAILCVALFLACSSMCFCNFSSGIRFPFAIVNASQKKGKVRKAPRKNVFVLTVGVNALKLAVNLRTISEVVADAQRLADEDSSYEDCERIVLEIFRLYSELRDNTLIDSLKRLQIAVASTPEGLVRCHFGDVCLPIDAHLVGDTLPVLSPTLVPPTELHAKLGLRSPPPLHFVLQNLVKLSRTSSTSIDAPTKQKLTAILKHLNTSCTDRSTTIQVSNTLKGIPCIPYKTASGSWALRCPGKPAPDASQRRGTEFEPMTPFPVLGKRPNHSFSATRASVLSKAQDSDSRKSIFSPTVSGRSQSTYQSVQKESEAEISVTLPTVPLRKTLDDISSSLDCFPTTDDSANSLVSPSAYVVSVLTSYTALTQAVGILDWLYSQHSIFQDVSFTPSSLSELVRRLFFTSTSLAAAARGGRILRGAPLKEFVYNRFEEVQALADESSMLPKTVRKVALSVCTTAYTPPTTVEPSVEAAWRKRAVSNLLESASALENERGKLTQDQISTGAPEWSLLSDMVSHDTGLRVQQLDKLFPSDLASEFYTACCQLNAPHHPHIWLFATQGTANNFKAGDPFALPVRMRHVAGELYSFTNDPTRAINISTEPSQKQFVIYEVAVGLCYFQIHTPDNPVPWNKFDDHDSICTQFNGVSSEFWVRSNTQALPKYIVTLSAAQSQRNSWISNRTLLSGTPSYDQSEKPLAPTLPSLSGRPGTDESIATTLSIRSPLQSTPTLPKIKSRNREAEVHFEPAHPCAIPGTPRNETVACDVPPTVDPTLPPSPGHNQTLPTPSKVESPPQKSNVPQTAATESPASPDDMLPARALSLRSSLVGSTLGPPLVQWQWCDQDGVWRSYFHQQLHIIERAWKKGADSVDIALRTPDDHVALCTLTFSTTVQEFENGVRQFVRRLPVPIACPVPTEEEELAKGTILPKAIKATHIAPILHEDREQPPPQKCRTHAPIMQPLWASATHRVPPSPQALAVTPESRQTTRAVSFTSEDTGSLTPHSQHSRLQRSIEQARNWDSTTTQIAEKMEVTLPSAERERTRVSEQSSQNNASTLLALPNSDTRATSPTTEQIRLQRELRGQLRLQQTRTCAIQ
eukprot:TRINITY_DN5940_c1_g1_i2.p1 TRINITY_DN5940_c1_g1~~TRINITY_DN5940_c1_g1_i2.p1  ORF type:complete len:1097 (+),score=102.40 TRINITY_DN5940_c1_g1_i2:42-3332(+)